MSAEAPDRDAPSTTLAVLRARVSSRPLLGTILVTPGAEQVELLGGAGLDFVCIDQMVASTDWSQTADMLRAAAACGLSGWVRLPAFPWGTERQGAVLQRDVLRALAIGADAVVASVDYADDLAAMLAACDGQHRKIWVDTVFKADPAGRPLPTIFPLIESLGALERLHEFAALGRAEAVFLGLGDLGRLLGTDPDLDNPKIQDLLRSAVEQCGAHSVTVMAGAGYRDSPSEVARAVETLWKLGVGVAWLPLPTFVTHRFYSELVRAVHGTVDS